MKAGPAREVLRATVLEGTRGIARAAMRGARATQAIMAGTPEGIAARTLAAIAGAWAIVAEMPLAIVAEIRRALAAWAATQLRAARYL
jgi:hypothetical protein